MKVAAWTIKSEDLGHLDYWEMLSSAEEVEAMRVKLENDTAEGCQYGSVYCWCIGEAILGSEPHYVGDE